MKVVCILGSPRANGNSAAMAEAFCDEARTLGAGVDVFELNKMDYRGCQGCGLCKSRLDHCALEDELTPVLEAVRACDVMVLASPVYFHDVTGQMKCFIDRCYSYAGPNFKTDPLDFRLPRGKSLMVLQTQGAPEEMFADVPLKYMGFFQAAGFDKGSGHVRACSAMEPDTVTARPEVLDQVRAEARRLLARA